MEFYYLYIKQVPCFLYMIFLQAFQSYQTTFLSYCEIQEIVQYLYLYHI